MDVGVSKVKLSSLWSSATHPTRTNRSRVFDTETWGPDVSFGQIPFVPTERGSDIVETRQRGHTCTQRHFNGPSGNYNNVRAEVLIQ